MAWNAAAGPARRWYAGAGTESRRRASKGRPATVRVLSFRVHHPYLPQTERFTPRLWRIQYLPGATRARIRAAMADREAARGRPRPHEWDPTGQAPAHLNQGLPQNLWVERRAGSPRQTHSVPVCSPPRGGRRCSSAAAGSCSSVRRSSPASSGAGLRSWCVATCARFAPTCSRRTFNRCEATCRRTGPASSSTAGAPGRCARGSTR